MAARSDDGRIVISDGVGMERRAGASRWSVWVASERGSNTGI